jgi:uncharacterized protein YndB with AHSA1/START domain
LHRKDNRNRDGTEIAGSTFGLRSDWQKRDRVKETNMSEATAQVSKVIAAAPEAVWKALTTPASLKKFFFDADVESDWRVGHPIHMKGEFQGKRFHDKGAIIAMEPQKRLSFSHWSALSGAADTPENYHVVNFDLAPRGDATMVTLTQSNLIGGAKPSDLEHRSDYEKNWQRVLDGLASVVVTPH